MKAVDIYEQLAGEDSLDFFVNYQLARLYQQIGKTVRAIGIYDRLYQTDTTNVTLLKRIEDCYNRIGWSMNAVDHYLRAFCLDPEDGETVVYKFVPGYKAGEQVVVVDNPAWNEDTCRITNQRKDKYIVPAGTKFRVRVVKKGDNFGISAEGITSATRSKLDKGAFLTIDSATGKLVAATEVASSPIMEAVVESKRIVGGTLVTAAHNYGYSRVMYEAKVKVLSLIHI